MLGDSSSVLATTTTASGSRGGGEASAAAPSSHLEAAAHHVVGSNINSGLDQERGGGVDEGDRSLGGNRWPREETLTLLRIRSDMDVAFRDASVKGPLWEEVSRKLAEAGYYRSAKKCKEKFENVFKYHKRTKDSRTGKHDGKTYRFFDQLEAFQSLPPPSHPPSNLQQPHPVATTMPVANPSPPPPQPQPPLPTPASSVPPPPPFSITSTNPTRNVSSTAMPSFSSGDLFSNSTSSSSTSSDAEIQGRKKRKLKDFFEGLMKEVIQKQEEMQKRFLEAIEKREQERMAREESWRMQEIARINREREILAQERSMASAKDAAVMAFLQKMSEEQNPGNQQQIQQNPPQPPPPPPVVPFVIPQPVQTISTTQHQQQLALTPTAARGPVVRSDNNEDQWMSGASASRWPKVEIEALIHLRTDLDSKYEENGPKGPLWEEISAGMRKLGYNRNAKRCKEKWENINKYYKKVKESNKRRPEDSKTCPYFHQLDALYRQKNAATATANSVPLMVRPEQQWPPPPRPPQPQPDSGLEDLESDDPDGDDDDEDEAGGYEVVPNMKTSAG